MATELFATLATTTLNGAITSGATSLVVQSASGFPSAATGVSQFRLRVDGELMLVTNVSGTTFTVTRGIEGTSAVSHLSGASVESVLTAGALAQMKTDILAAAAGAFDVNGMRLTLTSGTPVTTGDVTAAGTIYLTPYKSDQISLFTSGAWGILASAQVSLALSALTSGKNYDVFAYNASGTLTLELSAAWSSDTARTDALAQQDGVWVKSADHSRRYIGTIRTTGTTTTEDSAAHRFCWNFYNQQPRLLNVQESTTSWTDSTTSFRPANNNSANAWDYVSGMADTFVEAYVMAFVVAGGNTNTVGVGVDSTTVNSALESAPTEVGSGPGCNCSAKYYGYPGLGYHKLTWLEYVNQSSSTWYGQTTGGGTPRNGQSGMSGRIAA